MLPADLWRVEPLLAEHVRLFAKEVIPMKYSEKDFCAQIVDYQPDVLIMAGSEQTLTPLAATFLRGSDIKKVWWMTSIEAASHADQRLLQAFSAIFVPQVEDAEALSRLGTKAGVLPFGADPARFYQRHVDERHASGLLLVGQSTPARRQCLSAIRQGPLEGGRILAMGKGWEGCPGVETADSGVPSELYYNGAAAAINWEEDTATMLEMAACGTPQFIWLPDAASSVMAPGVDMIPFAKEEELPRLIHHYWHNPDKRRAVATAALERSRYEYSYVQISLKLLKAAYQA